MTVSIQTQTSTDLKTYVENATEEKSRLASDVTKWIVSTAADTDRKFLSATAKGRESD
ncbi:MAG: hypothetical protein AAGA18_04780 [Verrucomicrobiota bacterium]